MLTFVSCVEAKPGLKVRSVQYDSRVNPDESAEVIAAASAIVELIDSKSGQFTSSMDNPYRQYGAAGLQRGCGLLRAALSCQLSGHDEAIGILTRSLIECTFSGAFIMFGEAKSFARMEAEQRRQERTFLDINKFNAAELIELRRREMEDIGEQLGLTKKGSGSHFDRLSVETIAAELGPLVSAKTGEPEDGVVLYNLFYRPYSMLDAHGLRPLERQLDFDHHHRHVTMTEAVPWLDPHGSIAIGALVLAVLAQWVFKAYDIDPTDVQGMFKHLGPIVEQVGAKRIEQAPQEVLDVLPRSLDAHSTSGA
jgi:hypothetical protein